MSLDIACGDEVITTPFTFFATAGCIARTGARPVFVDIDRHTYNINPELLERAITKNTKAIIPVHLFGQMCEMDPIMEVAQKYGLAVIEDAAQSITAIYKGRKAGSIGRCGCFSFFPSKNLGAAGDGGMIVTNDEDLFDRLATMRSHGAKPKYYHKYIGGNFRLDPLQAAVLLVKLQYLDEWSDARRAHAAEYDKWLKEVGVKTPLISDSCVSIYNQYVIRTERRDALKACLDANQIGTEIYYPVPLHLQECFRYLGYSVDAFPEAESAAKQVLALPVYPEMRPSALEAVVRAISSFSSTGL
jgi:dTDP-4-amino-4,6-dideoxygalactose transaminase